MDIEKLFNSKRRKHKTVDLSKPKLSYVEEVRTEFERDYDRILFSTPVRRLADKTQVFPLEKLDSIRTRLTHSYEVANLARSIGVYLASKTSIFSDLGPEAIRNVPSILAASGLAHDLGNPPFGHQGEEAISSWFRDNEDRVLNDAELNQRMKNDFLLFEGNAQTLRILTRLQIIDDQYGLDLTFGTLGSLMKYTVPSDEIDDSDIPHVAKKKFGYFASEESIVKDIWDNTGLDKGKRHPLTYIMEACDDIAYTILDAEDAVKKKLASFHDLISFLKHYSNNDRNETDPVVNELCEVALYDNKKYRERHPDLSPSELNDISMQKFRVYAIGIMITCVTKAFIENKDEIMEGVFSMDLIGASKASILKKSLKEFDKKNAYRNQSVLEVELQGYKTIRGIMDYLWKAIEKEQKPKRPVKAISYRDSFELYIYQRISENYRRVYETPENKMPKRYKQLQLMTDMVSGMTDNYAINFYNEIRHYDVNHKV